MNDRLATYLEQLPDGWASFPECTAKAVLFARLMELARTEWLPPQLVHRLEEPMLPTAWSPEVEHTALLLVIYDHRVRNEADEAAFQEDMLSLNLKLFQSPAYAPLVADAKPGRLMRTMSESWNLFHRGSTLTLREEADGRVLIDFRFPPPLFPETTIRARMTSLRGALMSASATGVHVEHFYEAPGHVRYEASWDIE